MQNEAFVKAIADKLLDRLNQIVVLEKQGESIEERGRNILKQFNSEADEEYSYYFYVLLLECLEYWATCDSTFSIKTFDQVYTNLKEAKINFPDDPMHIFRYSYLVEPFDNADDKSANDNNDGQNARRDTSPSQGNRQTLNGGSGNDAFRSSASDARNLQGSPNDSKINKLIEEFLSIKKDLIDFFGSKSEYDYQLKTLFNNLGENHKQLAKFQDRLPDRQRIFYDLQVSILKAFQASSFDELKSQFQKSMRAFDSKKSIFLATEDDFEAMEDSVNLQKDARQDAKGKPNAGRNQSPRPSNEPRSRNTLEPPANNRRTTETEEVISDRTISLMQVESAKNTKQSFSPTHEDRKNPNPFYESKSQNEFTINQNGKATGQAQQPSNADKIFIGYVENERKTLLNRISELEKESKRNLERAQKSEGRVKELEQRCQELVEQCRKLTTENIDNKKLIDNFVKSSVEFLKPEKKANKRSIEGLDSTSPFAGLTSNSNLNTRFSDEAQKMMDKIRRPEINMPTYLADESSRNLITTDKKTPLLNRMPEIKTADSRTDISVRNLAPTQLVDPFITATSNFYPTEKLATSRPELPIQDDISHFKKTLQSNNDFVNNFTKDIDNILNRNRANDPKAEPLATKKAPGSLQTLSGYNGPAKIDYGREQKPPFRTDFDFLLNKNGFGSTKTHDLPTRPTNDLYGTHKDTSGLDSYLQKYSLGGSSFTDTLQSPAPTNKTVGRGDLLGSRTRTESVKDHFFGDIDNNMLPPFLKYPTNHK